MSNAYTDGRLRHALASLNIAAGVPCQPFDPDTGKWSVGTYLLERAEYGYQLQKVVNESGGVREINYNFLQRKAMTIALGMIHKTLEIERHEEG